MTQRGALVGLVVWLAVGCAQSAPKPDTETGGGSGGDGGGTSDAGAGRDGGADAGGSGAGGAGAGGAGAGGDAGELACAHAQPRIAACIRGDGISLNDRNVETQFAFTGTVELRKSYLPLPPGHPDSLDCFETAASRWVGYPARSPHREDQEYVVRDGEAAIAVTLATGSDRPLLAIGQRVRVQVHSIPSFALHEDSSVLSVLDDADGRILFWIAHTVQGFEQLELPPGFTASDAGPECAFDFECNGASYRRSLTLLEGNEEVVIAPGELASIGGVEALLIDNVERTKLSGPDVCFDGFFGQRITLALFDPALIAQCDWRLDELAHKWSEEAWCKDDEDCHEVRANIVGYQELFPRLIACVEDNSCSDGDDVTCAINDHTEQRVEFTTTCVPPGWTEAYGACDGDADAGLP